MNRSFTPEEDAYLIETYATVPPIEQAAHLGRTYNSVSQRRSRLLHAGKLDVTKRAGHRIWTEDEAVLIELMLQNGSSVVRIASKLRRTVAAVESFMTVRKLRAKQLRQGVWTMTAVARLFGVSQATVATWIQRKWLRAQRNNAATRRRNRTARSAAHYLINDDAIQAIIERRETWPAWEPEFMGDANWKDYAEDVRRAAGGHWMTTWEVAQQFGYSRTTVKHWRETGKMTAITMIVYDGRYYYWSADFTHWRPVDRRVEREAA